MIVETIKEAREAADQVRVTKHAIRNAGGLRGSSRLGLEIKRSGYGDPVAEAMAIREQLRKRLLWQERYAVACHARMMEEIRRIPSAVTQQVFLRHYYDGCSWGVVAKSVGIGVQAAKMRRKRYLDMEGEHHAVEEKRTGGNG